MREIELLMEHIEDELDDACTYAKLALEYKLTDPETANLFYKLSQEEMTHMDALHKRVVVCIEKTKQTRGEVPAAMSALYEYLHKRDVEKSETIVALQNLYKK